MMKNILNLIFDILFPKTCLGCRKEGNWLCPDCLSTIEVLESFFCLCEKPQRLASPGKCPKCRNHSLDGLYFAAPYQGLAKKLIDQCRYPPYVKELGRNLADLIITHLFLAEKQADLNNAILLALPIDKKDLKSRGFNPAEEISRFLSTKFKVLPSTLDPESKRVFLINDIYSDGRDMENQACLMKKAGAREVWGITAAREEI